MLVTLGGQGLITRKSLVYAHYKWNLAFKYFSSSLVESVVESTNTEADGILAGKWKSPGDGQEQPIMVHMCENCNKTYYCIC